VKALIARVQPGICQADIDDLAQRTFLTLYETAGRYEDRGRLKSWLCGIAVRTVRGWRRRTWVRRQLHTLHGSLTAGVAIQPDVSPDRRIDAQNAIEAALASLPPAQREVLILHTIEGLSGAEVAKILHIRVNTVWTRLHRARTSLAAQREGHQP
jgi:RNA polymerase sigma factor CnrH